MIGIEKMANRRSKLRNVSVLFLSISILISIFFLYQTLNPSLSAIQVIEKNKVGTYPSPDREKSVTVYFNGGLIFHNDVTYVGVLEDINAEQKKNFFLVAPNVKEVRWVDNSMIVVNGKEIAIDDTYDFRKH